MRKLRKDTTAGWVAVALLIAIGLIGLPIVSASLLVREYRNDHQRLASAETENLITFIAESMRQPIWNLDPAAASSLIETVEADARFVSLRVTSDAQGVLLDYKRSDEPAGEIVERSVPVVYEGEKIGEVRAHIDPGKLIVESQTGWLPVYTVIGLQLLFSLGAVALLLLFATRITRNRALARANREVEAMRALMQATMDMAPIAISIRDRDLRFVFANRTTLEKYDRSPEDFIGKTSREVITDRLDGDYVDYLESVDRQVFETGKAVPLTPVRTRREGAWRESLISKTPILDDNGAITHIVTVAVDVTELSQALEAAEAAREEAELANMAKSEFLANMSHELRTPLNAILGFSEVILAETFGPLENPRYKEYVRDIHNSGDHLHTIISDLLDVARIEIGAVDFELVDIDLGEVLDSVRVMEASKADRAGISLLDRTSRPLPKVRGDAVRLRQIFLNLIDNAIKFTDPGGMIEITANIAAGNRLAVTVADTGIGISAGDIERIVEPFVRVQAAATRNISGTGLGLSLVKSLTELHGGEFAIESEPGRGTRITVELPCAGSTLQVVPERAIA